MIHLLLLLLLIGPARADDVALAAPGSGDYRGLVPAGPPPSEDKVEELTNRISSGLRCTVCQGLSVADSPSEGALLMKERVREMVALGYDQQQIEDWFVSRWGEWVLLEPRREGFNWVVWLAPGGAAGLGFAWLVTVVVRWRREDDEIPLPSDAGLLPKDSYEERLLAEMEE